MMAAEAVNERSLGRLLTGLADVAVVDERALTGLTLDSRRVEPGFAFVALAGTRGHGLDHLAAALAGGAVAVLVDAAEPRLDAARHHAVAAAGAALVEVPGLMRNLGTIAARFHGRPAEALERVTATTGTDGKSSVTHFIADLRSPHATGGAGVLGTLGCGRPGALSAPGLTTPDAVALQATLAELLDQGISEIALEASSHGLAQHRLDGTRIDVAILTQLGRDHLDYHADEASYAGAKARLFDWPGLQGVALNLGDAFGRRLLEQVRPHIRRVGYGRGRVPVAPTGTLSATALEPRPDGIRCRLHWHNRAQAVTLPLLGTFNVDNALAAVAGLLAAGDRFEEIVAGLEGLRPVPGRMELFRGSQGPGLVVDYAHNAGALAAVLAALRAHARGRIGCVFGAGGDRDRGKRALMARAAAAGADRVIITDDNPRSEDPAAIVADIAAGMPPGTAYTIEHDRARAIERAWQDAGPDDLVLVAGKGHETTQVRGETTVAWSDREAAAALVGGATGAGR